MIQGSEDSQPLELFNRRSRGDYNNHIGVDEHFENAAEQPATAAPAPPAEIWTIQSIVLLRQL